MLAVVCTSGCVGFTNWLLWGLIGQEIPAEYDDLEGQRVAVVCATKSSPFEPGRDTGAIAREVSKILEREIKEIELVDVEEIADWMDQTNWSHMDYKELGRGVKADKVLAIEFVSLSFQDNPNEIRGRAEFTVSVFDIAAGKRVFTREEPEHVFPSHGPAGTTPRQFKTIYIQRLAQAIAQLFYAHDFTQGFGNDAIAL